MYRRLSYLAFLLMAAALWSGCAALTDAQVAEVGRFAAAAKKYTDLPGAVIAEHAQIRRERQVLRASSLTDRDAALAALDNALMQEGQLKEQGRQADEALQVLTDYAQLLLTLTAGSYTRELQAGAAALGQKVDSGIDLYNKRWHASLGKAGSTISALVREAGGYHLRTRQARALKEVVFAADPVVASLTKTVQETMALYLTEEQLRQLAGAEGAGLAAAGTLAQEKKDVRLFYRDVVERYQGKQPPELPLKVAEVMSSADGAALLAAQALKAAGAYRRAHGELAAMLREKGSVSAVPEVQALVAQIESALLQKKVLDRQ